MDKIAFLIALAVGAAQASGAPTRPPNHAPKAEAGSAPERPAGKTVDLDLNLDFADEEPVPEPRITSAPPASHAWVYWALGATATAAAGGLGWYMHENQAKEPAVTRSEQVFTDDR